MITKPIPLPTDLSKLTPVQRKRKVPVKFAAEFNDQHEDTFRRNHGHLIKRVSKRRQAVELGDMIDLPPPPEQD
jgi:hypothetical protein